MSRWAPTIILAIGTFLTIGPDRQVSAPLRLPLDSIVPESWGVYHGRRVELTEGERVVTGVTDYAAREFHRDTIGIPDGTPAWFGIYIGYYANQTDGRTIHSPRNCLPGGGWEPLTNRREVLIGPYGDAPVNRYLIQNGNQLALVLYWYQGRGRVAAGEYLVKWELLRDGAVRGRTEEALVRVVVPVFGGDEEQAWELARRFGEGLMHDVARALPE